MARILMLDRGLAFGPDTPDREPLGGAESAFAWLARALAARGHAVTVRTQDGPRVRAGGLDWGPLGDPVPEADMVVANRRWELFALAPRGGRRVLWLHNRAQPLGRIGARLGLLRTRPTLVVTSAYHRATLPPGLFGCPVATIPLAPGDAFRTAELTSAVPPPRAIFTSNPVRGLDRLLDLWAERIRPAVPGAELHLFGGPEIYRTGKGRKAGAIMARVLERARGMAAAGVRVNPPADRAGLVRALRDSRALLYPGSTEETYCLAAAEAQAMGVPVVLGDVGCLAERVADGETGFLTRGEDAFRDRAVAVLKDDALWSRLRAGALARRDARSWDDVAREFGDLA